MVRSKFVRSFALALTIAVFSVSCADNSPTAPAAPTTAANGLLSGLLGGVVQPIIRIVGGVTNAAGRTAHPVRWDAEGPNKSFTVSGTINYWGGKLTIPEAGFTITFPPGAVSKPTDVTITSDPEYVAYRMEPHGITFAKPVVVTQRLRDADLSSLPLGSQLFGVYLKNDALPLLDVLGLLDEILPSITILAPGSSTFPETSVWSINHFSRYMLASG
jgi:hypothetical protein